MATAPALLKNIANAFGKRIKEIVDKIAVIIISICHIGLEITRPLKLNAARIPKIAVSK